MESFESDRRLGRSVTNVHRREILQVSCRLTTGPVGPAGTDERSDGVERLLSVRQRSPCHQDKRGGDPREARLHQRLAAESTAGVKHKSRVSSPSQREMAATMRMRLGSRFSFSIRLPGTTISRGRPRPLAGVSRLDLPASGLGLGVGGTTLTGAGGAAEWPEGSLRAPAVEGSGVVGTGLGGTGGTASDGVGVGLVVLDGAWSESIDP